MLLSRLLGFVRDVLIAHLLGPGADAFLVVFRVPHFFRRLLAEGSLGIAHSVACSRIFAQQGALAVLGFSRHVWGMALLASLSLTGLLMLGAQPLLLLMAPGLGSFPEIAEQATGFLRICLLYLPLSVVCAVAYASRSATGDFIPQAYGSTLLNLAIISTTLAVFFLLHIDPTTSTYTAQRFLCFGIVAGGILQVLFSGGIPRGVRHIPFFHDGEAFAVVRKTPGLALGAAAHQLQVIAGTMIASFLAQGSISALYFAERLLELPLGLAGAAIGVAVLPKLAVQYQAEKHEDFSVTLGFGLRLSAFVSLPAAVGLLVLAHPLALLLFGHGAYEQATLGSISGCLAAYAPALPALCAARILLSAVALVEKDILEKPEGRAAGPSSDMAAGADAAGMRFVPAQVVLISLAVAVGAGIVCVPFMGVAGVALGSSLGAWCNVLLLVRQLRNRGVACPFRQNFRAFLMYALGALCMGRGIQGLLILFSPQGKIALAIFFSVTIVFCMIFWCGGWFFAGNSDLHGIITSLKKQIPERASSDTGLD